MSNDLKSQQAEDTANDTLLMERRNFLRGLNKWSKVVIGSALFGGAMLKLGAVREAEAGAWVNRVGGGGAWANRGGAWANRGGVWVNGGGSWINRF